ncbi:RagB/SusD family nutrient uptake outer membrane protein, partial [Acinetobacter baumannii]
MKKKLLYIVLVSATIITGTSCNKWLTLQPQDGITRQEFWETKEQIQSAVTGCYASLLADPAG